jgi:hypothetical protein
LAVIEDKQFGHYFRHLFWKRCEVVPVHAVSHVEDWNQLHSFLNSALYETERLVSRHGPLTFQESATVTQWICKCRYLNIFGVCNTSDRGSIY